MQEWAHEIVPSRKFAHLIRLEEQLPAHRKTHRLRL